MAGIAGSGKGLSHVVSMLLIVFLGLVIVMLVIGMLTGFAGLLQKPPVIAIRGSVYTMSTGMDILILSHFGGEAVSLNATHHDSKPAPVKFSVQSPANRTYPVGLSPAVVNETWRSGDSIIIYRDMNGYWVTDNLPARLSKTGTLGQLIDIDQGGLIVSITDAKTNSLITKVPIVVDSVETTGH
jgi:hypothetical protein